MKRILSLLLALSFAANAQVINSRTGNPVGVTGTATPNDCVKFADSSGNISDAGAPCGAGGGSGTVSSVGLSFPGVLYSVTGSPVTTSGTLTATLVTQTANTIFAGPSSGGAATPAFRALVGADIPSLSTGYSGVLPVTNGGNGLNTATLGDLRYGSGTNTLAALSGNTTTTLNVLSQTGNGTVSAAPVWTTSTGTGNVALSDSPTFTTGLTTPAISSTGALTINQASAQSVSILSGAATGTLNLANGASAQTINIGNAAGAKTVTIGSSNSTSSTQINYGSGSFTLGDNSASNINILGNAASGAFTVGANSSTSTISLGTGTGAQTINIGTGGAVKTVTLGSTNSTSVTNINSGSNGVVINNASANAVTILAGTSTGTFSLGTGAGAMTASFNTGAAAKTTSVGSTNTTSTTTVSAGSGGLALTAASINATGDLKLTTAGNGLYIKEGSNASLGVATLVAGTVTVSTTKVTANSRIMLTVQSLGTVVIPTAIAVTARTAATSFVITSAGATDTSVVAWMIVEPSP